MQNGVGYNLALMQGKPLTLYEWLNGWKEMEIIKLTGKEYYLRTLMPDYVTDRYVNWLNDSEVTRFLEVRFEKSTLQSVRSFVEKFDNKSKYLLGIFTSNDDKHIGNITLIIDLYHNTAYTGHFIGDKKYWGKNAYTEAIILLLDFSFNKLGLRRVNGSTYITNIPTIISLKSLGFAIEGRLRESYKDGNEVVDSLILSMLKREWSEYETQLKRRIIT